MNSTQKKKFNNVTTLCFATVSLALLVITQPEMTSDPDNYWIKIWSVNSFALAVLYFYLNKKAGFGSISLLFTTGFFIVHFQWAFMATVFDFDTSVFFGFTSYQEYFSYGVWLSALALSSLIFGLSLVKSTDQVTTFKLEKKYSLPYLNPLTWCLMVAFVVISGPSYFDGTDYAKGGMDAISGTAGYIHKFLKPMITLLLIEIVLKAKANGIRQIHRMVITGGTKSLAIFLYMIIFILAGDRGEFLQPILLAVLLWNYFVERISLGRYLTFVSIGAPLLMFSGLHRAGNTSDFVISNVFDATMNLAGSNRVLLFAIDDVASHGLHYGILWIGPLISFLPFAQATLISLSDYTKFDLSSPQYLTYMQFGSNSHTGVGSTIVADVFLNFGVIGVFLGFIILGVFIKKCEAYLKSGREILILLSLTYGSMAFFTSRDTYFGPMQFAIWVVALYFIFKRRVNAQI